MQRHQVPIDYVDPAVRELLTPSELNVALLLATGMSNKDIVQATHLSPHTVKNFVNNTLRKLGCENRTQAAVMLARYDERQRAAHS